MVPGAERTHPRTGHSSVFGLDCGHRLGSASCSWNRLPGFPPEFAAYVVALIAGSSLSHRPDSGTYGASGFLSIATIRTASALATAVTALRFAIFAPRAHIRIPWP